MLSIIAAYAHDAQGRQVIGKDNRLPWHRPHDLRRFKDCTLGNGVIMGRKTFESIGKVLPRRDVVIVSRQAGYSIEGAHVFHDLESALEFSMVRNHETFVAGGQELYAQVIDRADRLYLTRLYVPGVEGDTFFPEFDLCHFKSIHQEKVEYDIFNIFQRVKYAHQKAPTSDVSAYQQASQYYSVQEEDDDTPNIYAPFAHIGYGV